MPADGDDPPATTTVVDNGTLDLGAETEQRQPGAGSASLLGVGATIGRYELRRVTGSGGMGVVFEAWDPQLARTVAVKVLHGEAHRGGDDPARARQLQREGRVMAQLAHPNVLPVFDLGVIDGSVWVAMQHVRGGDLREWLATPRTPEEIVAAFVQAARGLAAAHDAGFVHRDFKPSNVLVQDGRMLVGDFGLARLARPEAAVAMPEAVGGAIDATVTRAGRVVGTPAYMAPEQHDGGAVDHRADQFALCVALWEALHGRRPFAGSTARELADSTRSGVIEEPPDQRRIAPRLRSVLRRGLHADPAERWPSMHALIAALAPAPRRRDRWIALGAAGAVVVVATVIVATRGGEPHANPCAPTVDRFAAVWSADARARVGAAFTRTGAAFAEPARREVERLLDERAKEWNAMRRDSCEATRVRGEQSDAAMDLRAACLDRMLAEVSAFVTVLSSADSAAVKDATRRASTVGDVAVCADAAALARRAQRPADPDARAAVEQLEREVAFARERAEAGGAARLGDEATALVTRARRVGYAPLLAEALMVRASAEEKTDRAPAAVATLDEAALAAEAGSDDRLRFDAEIRMIRLLGMVVQGRSAEARSHLDRATALLARLGNDPRSEALILRTRSILSWTSGNYAAALPDAVRAVELYERTAPDSADLARTLHLVAIIHDALYQNEKGIPYIERAIAIGERVFGLGHPTFGQFLQASAGLYRRVGRLAEAERDVRRGLAVLEAASGPRSSDVAGALINLANVQRQRGDLPGVVATLRRSVEIHEETVGGDHAWTALALHHLGSALSKTGKPDEAYAALTRASSIYVADGGPAGPPYSDVQRALAEHHLRYKRVADALPPAREAVRAMTAAQGEKSSSLARPLQVLGDVLRAAGRRSDARDAYARALAVVGDDPSDAARRAAIERALAELDRR